MDTLQPDTVAAVGMSAILGFVFLWLVAMEYGNKKLEAAFLVGAGMTFVLTSFVSIVAEANVPDAASYPVSVVTAAIL